MDERSLDYKEIIIFEKKLTSVFKQISVAMILASKFNLQGSLNELKISQEKAKEKLRKSSGQILDHFNTMYETDLNLMELIDPNDDSYYTYGILYVIHKNKLSDKIFQKALIDILPKDPVEMYPGARAMHRIFFLHCGPANSGKTYEALEKFKKCSKGVYLAPLRLLALEIFDGFKSENIPCNLITGEEEIMSVNAAHISSTVEMLNLSEEYDIAIIDEAQMLSDKNRGSAWTRAILGVKAKEIHLCCSENTKEIILKLIEICQDELHIIEHRGIPRLDLTAVNLHFQVPYSKVMH